MTDIIIQGIHGRMGRALCTMIEARTDCRVVEIGRASCRERVSTLV